jgi:hypothetical protein
MSFLSKELVVEWQCVSLSMLCNDIALPEMGDDEEV